MRVLFTIKQLEDCAGGAERVLVQISGALAAEGHDIEILSFDAEEASSFYAIWPSVMWTRIGHLRDAVVRRKNRMRTLCRRAFAIRRHVLRTRPDVIIGFMHSAYVPTALGMLFSRARLYGSEHGVLQQFSGRPVELLGACLASLRCSAITAVSEDVRASFPKWMRAKMVIARNPIDFEQLSELERVASPRENIILGAGRLTPEKDFVTLVQAFAQISDAFRDWRLRIVGAGECFGAIKAEIDRLGLHDRVEMVSHIKDMGSEYRRAKVFALSSRYESMGLVCIEALFCGLPVVLFSDCPGATTFLKHDETALYAFVPKDASDRAVRARAFAGALAEIIRDEALRARLADVPVSFFQGTRLEVVLNDWRALVLGKLDSSKRT